MAPTATADVDVAAVAEGEVSSPLLLGLLLSFLTLSTVASFVELSSLLLPSGDEEANHGRGRRGLRWLRLLLLIGTHTSWEGSTPLLPARAGGGGGNC